MTSISLHAFLFALRFLTKIWFLYTQDCGSVPTWRGTDLHRVLGEDIQFVQNIVERQLGGVLRVLSPRVQNGLPDGGGTYIEIWLPGVPNFEDS